MWVKQIGVRFSAPTQRPGTDTARTSADHAVVLVDIVVEERDERVQVGDDDWRTEVAGHDADDAGTSTELDDTTTWKRGTLSAAAIQFKLIALQVLR